MSKAISQPYTPEGQKRLQQLVKEIITNSEVKPLIKAEIIKAS